MIASIRSFGLITPLEYCSPAGMTAHPGVHLTDIPRESVYDEPYRPFGKMGDTEKLIFSALALAQQNIKLDHSTGIVLGVPRGSLATDCAYMASVRESFPSPALFAATLPSASIAELAIPFALRGPNRVIAGTEQSTVLANAFFLLRRGTPSVVCGWVNPDAETGFGAVLILDRESTGIPIEWHSARTDCVESSALFPTIIARLMGKNHIPFIKTAMGTFYINEATYGSAD